MKWQARVLKNFTLYAVTDLINDRPDIVTKIESAYRGGTDIIQLRSKVLSDAQLLRLGQKIKDIARKYRKLFFLNDRVDLAIAAGADGVHLGQKDLPLPVARKISKRSGCDLMFGKSTSCLAQAREAVREGADYIGVGPVYATPTKPDRVPAGLEYVRQAARHVPIPWVAIGGINLTNVEEVLGAGAKRIAVVRAVFASHNPGAAARQFKLKLGR